MKARRLDSYEAMHVGTQIAGALLVAYFYRRVSGMFWYGWN